MRPNESFIGQPIRSLQTMLRVIAEDDQRLPTVVPDGIYAQSTMNAVTAFQQYYGIPVTGITDQNTWEQIVEIYETAKIRVDKATPIEALLEPGQIITLGESNPYIFLSQAMLAYLSTRNNNITKPSSSGTLDNETSSSIESFQRIASLDETGDLDRITWAYLVNYFTLETHRANN